MKDSFQQLQREPTRDLWKICTRDFLEEISRRTKGAFDDYAIKITLDGILISQPHLERFLSWWPMQCPAYKDQLPKLYANLSKSSDDLFLAACHYHQNIKVHYSRYHLRDSLAQLCWVERGVT